MNNVEKYYPISDTHGYAIITGGVDCAGFREYYIHFGRKVTENGEETFKSEGQSTNFGRRHAYVLRMLAERAIEKEIKTLYES